MQHLSGVAVLPLGGQDAVADVPAVGQQIIVEVVAQVGHAHQMLLLVQRQILGGGDKARRGGGRVFQVTDSGQPCVKIGVLVQRRGAVHPGAEGEKLFPVGHHLLPVAFVRLSQVDLLGRGAPGGGAEIRGFHEAVAVAVKVQHSRAPHGEAGRGVALGVKLDQLQLVARQVGEKRDGMVLRHGVVEGDEKLVLYPLNGQLMVLVGVLSLGDILGGQGDSAAAHDGLPGAVEHIAADRADIELGAEQVGGAVAVDNGLALHQLQHRYPQRRCQRLQKRNIGQAFGRLPLGDGLGADGHFASQLGLGQVFGFSQLPDGAAGDVSVHGFTLLWQQDTRNKHSTQPTLRGVFCLGLIRRLLPPLHRHPAPW